MASSYSTKDLVTALTGDRRGFRDDSLADVTSAELFSNITESDGSRLELLNRIIEPLKDKLLEAARISQGTVAPIDKLVKYDI
jgi:hypothetical protein